MKTLFKVIFVLFLLILLTYVSLPNFNFPEALPNSLQSNEPGDSVTPLRRAYYTDMDRAEVLAFYKNQFSKSSFKGLPLPTFLLNYPPEEAQTIIRDQTQSSFLQEFVHPLRESLYVNGYTSWNPADFSVNGKHYNQKVTVKYVPSNILVRIGVVILIGISFVVIAIEKVRVIKSIKSIKFGKKINK
jgi:hypothetical protein